MYCRSYIVHVKKMKVGQIASKIRIVEYRICGKIQLSVHVPLYTVHCTISLLWIVYTIHGRYTYIHVVWIMMYIHIARSKEIKKFGGCKNFLLALLLYSKGLSLRLADWCFEVSWPYKIEFTLNGEGIWVTKD